MQTATAPKKIVNRLARIQLIQSTAAATARESVLEEVRGRRAGLRDIYSVAEALLGQRIEDEKREVPDEGATPLHPL